MEKQLLLDEQIVLLNLNSATSKEVLTQIAKKMQQESYVKSSFLPAVLERETAFPTGLPLPFLGVAIPHTDPSHVHKAAIGVATLQKPVFFQVMGSPEQTIAVSIVLMLAITDPAEQVALLSKLMNLFRKQDVMLAIKDAQSEKKVADLLQAELQ